MPGAVAYFGKWRIKPSGQMPIFLRFMINSSFTKANANKGGIKTVLSNRTYLNHMMYWPAAEYNPFEKEIVNHLKADDGWFEDYCRRELKKSEHLYKKSLDFKKINWRKKSNQQIEKILTDYIQNLREIACPWYAQYPLDEYFENTIEEKLVDYILADDPDFRKYVLIFTDPRKMTEVAEERWRLLQIAKGFLAKKENLKNLSTTGRAKINKHLNKFAYINRGLATSKPYTFKDMVERLKEIKKQVTESSLIDDLIYTASEEKIKDNYQAAIKKIKPKIDFQHIINQAREHSYLRNRRVEAFINADYGASYIYSEIARRANFNPNWIMEISIPEMFDALRGKPLPDNEEIQRRLKNYAMIVRNAQTKLVTDPKKIKKLEKEYFVDVDKVQEIHGRMACLGGIITGRAKVCLDKKEIGKVGRGDILVTQFTTPDFVPAMERAAAIVADQGGLSSHAAIVSRELGVPCVIATQNATRVIHDNDLLEIDAKKGIIKILGNEGKKSD